MRFKLTASMLPNASYRFPGPHQLHIRGWESNFFAEATGAAYQDLYDNHNGMADDMVSVNRMTSCSLDAVHTSSPYMPVLLGAHCWSPCGSMLALFR